MSLVASGTLIMIVDDDAELGQGIADYLAIEGYEALVLRSASAAWTEISNGLRPSAIVLDLWLTEMSSGELVRRLRASPLADVPILILSGARPAAHIEADVDAVLRKPADATTLVRAVDKLARRPRTIPAVASSKESMRRVRGFANSVEPALKDRGTSP